VNRTSPARRAAAALALAAALAGCASTTAGNGAPAAGAVAGGGSPTTLPVPGGSDTPAATPSGAPATPSGTPAPAGQRVQVGSVSVPVPAGARVRTEGSYLCLTLLNATGCSLEVIDIKATRAGGASLSTPAPGAPNGWWWGSDVPSCESGGQVSPITRQTVVRKGFEKVGPKNAAYASYLVACENSDLDFDPQVWWLPTSQIAFRQHSSVAGTDEAVDPILAGVTFGS
jgi:hypothetical protein